MTENSKNLFVKDFKVATAAAHAIVENADVESFCEICSKSEFIFDFIKEKAVKNLLDAVNEKNYRNLLKLTGCHSADFEDFVTLGLAKFASEDLTDELLEFFESGTDEQKTYCAGYFTYILDPLALEFLKEGASSDFLPLKTNCAQALKAFGDREIYDIVIENLKSSDTQALEAVEFLAAYGDSAAFEPIYEFMKNTPYAPYVALDLLGLKNFQELISDNDFKKAFDVFDAILNGYPEMLPLYSIAFADIKGLLATLAELVVKKLDSYAARLILKAKMKFDLIANNDNYTFDLDKNIKNEIFDIAKFLDALNKDELENALESEFKRDDESVIDLFEIVTELNLGQYAQKIAQKIKASNYPPLICEGAKALCALGKLELVDETELIAKFNDPNSIALLKSYFSSPM